MMADITLKHYQPRKHTIRKLQIRWLASEVSGGFDSHILPPTSSLGHPSTPNNFVQCSFATCSKEIFRQCFVTPPWIVTGDAEPVWRSVAYIFIKRGAFGYTSQAPLSYIGTVLIIL